MESPAASATTLNSDESNSQSTLRDAKRQEVSRGLPLFVEIFAGKATLSRAMIQTGFEVISIDHVADSPMAPIVSLDLTTSSGQKILWAILSNDRTHMGLPCGTPSRARDRPVAASLRQLGVFMTETSSISGPPFGAAVTIPD